MNKAIKCLDRVVSVVLVALTAFLAVGVGVTIVLRYFFGVSFATLEEFLTMSFIFITLFGAAIAVREKQHISISFVIDKIVGESRAKKRVSALIVDGVVVFVCAVMLKYSCLWIGKVGHLLSQNSHLPMKVFYVFMPLTFGLTLIYTLLDALGRFSHVEEADGGYMTDDKLPEEKP